MQVIKKKISELIPYVNNARTHSDEQIKKLAASIKEFGFTNPVLIDSQNGVIAGHGRINAALKLGMSDVPTICLDHLSDAQRKAYILADNRLALDAGWDISLLGIELEELQGLDFDLSLTGFTDDEIGKYLNPEQLEGKTDPDDCPEPPVNPVSVLGDVWLLGKHRLMCGDSTSINAVDELMGGEKAELVVTSPPYNAGNASIKYDYYGEKKPLYRHKEDNWSSGEYLDFLFGVFGVLSAVSKEDTPIIWNTAYNAKSRNEYGRAIFSEKNPFTVKESIVWDKKQGFPSASKGIHSRRCEFVFILSLGDKYFTNQGENEPWFNLWEIPSSGSQLGEHKACFPVGLPEKAILCFGRKKAVTLDPFGGSGSTLIACEKLNRQCRMMELDPKYCDVIIKRWQDFTGNKATLETTGETFEELSLKRD